MSISRKRSEEGRRRNSLPKTRHGELRSTSHDCRSYSDRQALIRIMPIAPARRMWSGRRQVLRIGLAIAAEPARGLHALLKCCEATVCTACSVVNRAPRIVLRPGWFFNAYDTDANYQHEQREPHARLLAAPCYINAWPPALFPAPSDRRGGSRRGFGTMAKLYAAFLLIATQLAMAALGMVILIAVTNVAQLAAPTIT